MNYVPQFALLTAVLLIGYSLLTAGKRGRGWFVISLLLAAATMLAKLLVSLFVEITTSYTPPDWDED